MKRGLIGILLILIAIPLANAEKEIFSGKVLTETDKAIDGKVFRFSYEPDKKNIFAVTPFTNLIIGNGECKSNDYFRICINAVNFSHKNITDYRFFYNVDLKIYSLFSKLGVNATYPKSILPGQIAEIKLTMFNPNNIDISNVEFWHETSPLIVMDSKGCDYGSGNLSWSGSLKPFYDKICTISAFSENDGTYSLKWFLKYESDYLKENVSGTTPITILKPQLEISRNFTAEHEIYEDFNIKLSLKNINKEHEIEAYLKYLVPDSLISADKLPNSQKIKLKPSESYNVTLALRGALEGKHTITESYEYAVGAVPQKIVNLTELTIKEPKPIVDFVKEYNEMLEGQKFIVQVHLKNPSSIHNMTDVGVSLKAPGSSFSREIPLIHPGQPVIALSNTLIAPEIGNASMNETAYLNVSVAYNLAGKQKYANSIDKVLIKKKIIKAEEEPKNAENISLNLSVSTKTEAKPPAMNYTPISPPSSLKEIAKFETSYSSVMGAALFFVLSFILVLLMFSLPKVKSFIRNRRLERSITRQFEAYERENIKKLKQYMEDKRQYDSNFGFGKER